MILVSFFGSYIPSVRKAVECNLRSNPDRSHASTNFELQLVMCTLYLENDSKQYGAILQTNIWTNFATKGGPYM